jgi:type VI secretion system secreted protein VgrG
MTYTQALRHLAVETVLGRDALLVRALSGDEGVSRPFHFTLDLTSTALVLDATRILGTPARVTIALPSGGERTIHGLVSRFRQSGGGVTSATSATSYQAELVPWLWMLSLSTDCRIFQNLSVPDIVTQIFGDFGFSDYRLALTRAYPPREFCVQYRETHLDFVSRLLEDEGIFYYFEHGAERHTLVMADSVAAARPAPALTTLRASATGDGAWGDDLYSALTVERSVHTQAVELADYNYLNPSAPLQVPFEPPARPAEAFDYPGGFADAAERDRYMRLRLEEAESARVTATGTSHAPALTSGYSVNLAGNARRAHDDAWFVLAVRHDATQGGFVGGAADAPFTYRNEFTLVPAAVPWRPPRRTPRPYVRGTQSALVVGTAGEEIWTDAHGRVKLHFYWDRRSQRNENSSCWVRCSMAWAGRGYGQFSVPRIGQEVLVDFLEGDPDRPVVVGRVYNADQPPPCDPGGSRGVVSGMRSQTHKGAGYNAMEMNDTAGQEKISIHAQYDMDTVVEHDDTQTVKTGNRKIDVLAGTHTETIKGNTTITIATGNFTHDVQTGTATIHVKGAVAETFEDSQTTTVTHNVTIDGGDQIRLVSGDSSITLTKAGKITIHCKNLEVIGDTDIKASAPKVAISGGDEAKIGVGNQQMTCDKAKVSVSGAAINASAVGTHEITGALVKIN